MDGETLKEGPGRLLEPHRQNSNPYLPDQVQCECCCFQASQRRQVILQFWGSADVCMKLPYYLLFYVGFPNF